jgi:hypothetical protein
MDSKRDAFMSTHGAYVAGVLLEYYVSRLEATNRLRGKGARNTAHYYKCEKGFCDGIAACLEAIGDRSGAPRIQEQLDDAKVFLRKADPKLENPERFPNVAHALLHLVGALVIASR